ncbi:hypothetical protein BKA82DRAFT_4189836, partial [Pisolithus tinctorius]
QPVLDLSPVHLPFISDFPIRRSLKRSASVAALPALPHNRHERSPGQTRSPTSRHVADDDRNSTSARATRIRSKSSEDKACQPLGDSLKRTALVLPSHDDDEEEETAFWMGGKRPDGKKAKKESEQGEPLDNSIATPPQIFLRTPPSLAKAPTRKTRKTWPKKLPTRDSPDNPFLNNDTGVPNKKGPSEWDCSDDEACELVLPKPVCKEGEPTPVSSYGERSTITYVFRGQKATMANPLYSVSPDAVVASRLPIDHPDYEPLEVCPPKRLFFSGGKRKTRDNSRDSIGFSEGVKRVRSHVSDSDGESPQLGGEETKEDNKIILPSDEDREPVSTKPPREPSQHRPDPEQESDAREALRRAREERERRVRADKERLGQLEGLCTGAVVTRRDGPIRRACGPPRNA